MCEQSFHSAHCCVKTEIKYIVHSEGKSALRFLLCHLHGSHILKAYRSSV